jgi:hypothetical protein
MEANPNKWKMFMTEDDFPHYPDYGQRFTGGCLGFGKNIMKWPEDLIIGGVKRDNHQITSASAFQRYVKNVVIKITRFQCVFGSWSI